MATRKSDDSNFGNGGHIHFSIYDLDRLEMKIDDDGDLLIIDRTEKTLNTATITVSAAVLDEFVADVQRARALPKCPLCGESSTGGVHAHCADYEAMVFERSSNAGRGVG